jgi:hypothetical protein
MTVSELGSAAMEVLKAIFCPLRSSEPSTDQLLPASAPNLGRTGQRYGLLYLYLLSFHLSFVITMGKHKQGLNG